MDMPMFAHKKPNGGKLQAFGFVRRGEAYVYATEIEVAPGERFAMQVRIGAGGEVQTRLVDADGGEYVLHRNEGVAGAFVGAVRVAHDGVLQQIARECFDQALFTAPQTLELIDYIRERYGGELEFLWAKLPLAAVWRRPQSRKWYGLLMAVDAAKLGLGGEGPVEALNLHCRAEEMAGRLAAGALPGYHMNKKYWFTVLLDGRIDFAVLAKWLEASWDMAKK